MPRGDRTGPRGMGAMTGRAAGYCVGSGMPGNANFMPGGGFGGGFGRCCTGFGQGFGNGGRGRRNMFYATGLPGWIRFSGTAAPQGYGALDQKPDPEMEKQVLKSRMQALQSELDLIKKRWGEIETSTTGE